MGLLQKLFAGCALTLGLGACGGAGLPAPDSLEAMRNAAADSNDGETIGRLLLGEMFAPGGDAKRAEEARRRLDATHAKGMYASLARSIDDEAHGRFRRAALEDLDALVAARTDGRPDAPLVGWFAASHLLNLRTGVANLWESARDVVTRTLENPGNIGWRARGELVEWWSLDGFRDGVKEGDKKAPGMLDAAAKRYGCVEKARMAGPFGHLAATDHRAHFDAERAGPWPAVFPRDPRRIDPPRVLGVERLGCSLHAVGASGNGVFYVETFVDLPVDRELIVAVQGSLAIFVDDLEVLTRDTKEWGIWPRFGAHVRLEAGHHRILARVAGPDTSMRLLAPNGVPLDVPSSIDASPPYDIAPPALLEDPNVLAPFMSSLGVPPQRGTPALAPRDTSDPIARVLASYLAHIEEQDDVAAVLMEPLVKDPVKATGPALAIQAAFFEKDPIFPRTDARDLAKDVRARAAAKDPELWWPKFWLALDEADKSGMPEVAPKLQALADHFREVPDILKGLATIYAKIGWKVEQTRAVKDAAERFPDDVDALGGLLRLYDEQGQIAEADAVAARIRKLDLDSEVDFERAVERRDYKAAIKELERLGKVRKDRRDIAARVADMLTRAGLSSESLEKLEGAVAKAPQDPGARLALADARFARGDHHALQSALIEAIHSGSDTSGLREAIELVDGINELSAYRIDGRKVIAEFEASKAEMPGTAARILDYSALWIHADGSARMLEHEIIGIQSREGIQEHAEQRLPRGLVLHVRTIKRDGRVLEPEFVEGKQTVTMPHLEVGDYIETESLVSLRGDGQGGRMFEGPRWFFREEKIPYWRSEFVTISPKNRPLDIETGGAGVPNPETSESGALVTRRWRVDKSPALPEEPASAPIQEFLPNVRVGWGINQKDTIARLVDAASDETPRDPRLVRVAEAIVRGEPAGKAQGAAPSPRPPSIDERARRIYRWVLSNVEAGRETDGRRAVIGKSGNRTEAFLYLCRLTGIDATLGVIRDRLTAPSIGPMSEAEQFSAVAVRVTTETGARWMIVRDKFAPYGYMPNSLRGQAAILLKPGAPHETTPTTGSVDGVTHDGTVELAADGSARIELEQRYEGKLAILLRSVLETLPDARLKETIEARLLPQTLPGARVISVDVKNLGDLDAPLVLSMKLEMSNFARPRPGELVIAPPFPMHLGTLAQLPVRETPLYIAEQIATRVTMRLRVKLPEGAHLTSRFEPMSAENEGRTLSVKDRAEARTIVLERTVDLPAGRIQPPSYARFQEFARHADASLHRDIVIGLH